MLAILLYAAVSLLLALLILPIVLRMRLEYPHSSSALHLEISIGLVRGLVGVEFVRGEKEAALHPLLLGRRLGFLRMRLSPRSRTKPISPAPPQPSPPRSPAAKKDPSVTVRALLRPALRMLASLPRAVRVERLHLAGLFGFADPARTGSLFGYLQALKAVGHRRCRLDLSPDFTEAGFRGRCNLFIHLHFGLLLLFLLRFALQASCRWLAHRFAWIPWNPRLI